MNCAVRTKGIEMVSGGVKITAAGVVTEETPEILYYLAMGWIERVADGAEIAPVVETVSAKPKRTR